MASTVAIQHTNILHCIILSKPLYLYVHWPGYQATIFIWLAIEDQIKVNLAHNSDGNRRQKWISML